MRAILQRHLTHPCFGVLLATVVLFPSVALAQYQGDGAGGHLRVEFPVHDRWVVGAATSVGSGEGVSTLSTDLRLEFGVDFPDEQIWWRLRHRILETQVSTTLAGRFTAVKADYWRHDTGSIVLIPGDINIKLPAPFDIHAGYSLASVAWTDTQEVGSIDTIAVNFGADFIRDSEFRSRLAVLFEGGHRYDAGSQKHHIVPLSGLLLKTGWEAKNGRFRAFAGGGCGYEVVVDEVAQKWGPRCQGNGEVEWIPLAINDTPLSVPLAVEWSWKEQHVWAVQIGLRWSLPVD